MLLFGLIVVMAMTNQMQVALNDHAVMKHGNDALAVRNCLDNNGPVQVWRTFDKATYFLICKTGDREFGIQPVTKDGFEKTAFIKGAWNDTMKYLGKLGTKFTGQLPWIR